MKVKHNNILDEKRGIIVHGINAQGKMNFALAKQIREKYPQVYTDYMKKYTRVGLGLGDIITTQITKELIVVSGVTQRYYGKDTSIRYCDYDAIRDVFKKVKRIAYSRNLPIYFPKIGCGAGRGDWDIVREIIIKELTVIPDDVSRFVEASDIKQLDYCLFDYIPTK